MYITLNVVYLQEVISVHLVGLKDAQVIEHEEHAKQDVTSIGMIARDMLTAWSLRKNK